MSLWSRLQRRLGDLAGELVLDEYRDQLNQARQLLAERRRPAAIESLEALLSVKPEHGQALIVLGEARLATREPQRGARGVRAGARSCAAETRRRSSGIGLGAGRTGRVRGAITPLARAVAEAGGDRGILADAYRGLGIAWRRRGDLDKAIRELRKAVVEDGEDSMRARRSARRWSPMAGRTTRRCATSSARPPESTAGARAVRRSAGSRSSRMHRRSPASGSRRPARSPRPTPRRSATQLRSIS